MLLEAHKTNHDSLKAEGWTKKRHFSKENFEPVGNG